MGLSSFRAWLRDLPECLFPTTHHKRQPSRKVRRFRPQVLLLEDRCLLDAALGDLAFAEPFADLASADHVLRDPLDQEPPALVHNLAPSGNAAAPGTSSTGGGAGGTAVSGPSTTTAGPSPDGAPVQQALLEGMAAGQPEAPTGAGAGSFSLTGPAAPASTPASSGAGASAPPVSLVAATSGGTLAALGSGTGAAAASSSPLSTSSHGTSFTLTGAVGAEVAAFAAAAEWGGSSGTLTLSKVPADALIEFATLYATLDLAGPVTASATFAGQSLGDASP